MSVSLLLQDTTAGCEGHPEGPGSRPSGSKWDTAYWTRPQWSYQEWNKDMKAWVLGILCDMPAKLIISAGWSIRYPDWIERKLIKCLCQAVMCIFSFHKYLTHVRYSMLTLNIIYSIVLFLPKTVLFAHLHNSLYNVTLDSLINIKIWYIYLVFDLRSVKLYFTLEKCLFCYE
jgi:hypothetical protein